MQKIPEISACKKNNSGKKFERNKLKKIHAMKKNFKKKIPRLKKKFQTKISKKKVIKNILITKRIVF